MADKFSKITVFGNWLASLDVFDELTVRRGGVVTIHRFVRKVLENKDIFPETLEVDAIMFYWMRKLNWPVPAVHLIRRTVKHYLSSTRGFTKTKFNSFKRFVRDYYIIENAKCKKMINKTKRLQEIFRRL